MENIISIRLRAIALIWAVPILFGIAFATGLVWLSTPHSTWAKVAVDLPTSGTLFPAGNGADIASAQCLICHSAGMVLRQPPLTEEEWVGEINKMRNSFGAHCRRIKSRSWPSTCAESRAVSPQAGLLSWMHKAVDISENEAMDAPIPASMCGSLPVEARWVGADAAQRPPPA